MRAWHRKAVRDGLKSLIPFQPALRRLKRALVPYATDPSNDPGLLADVLDQIAALGARGRAVQGSVVVEIGTGWKPILPVAYWLAGAARIISVDQERLLDAHTIGQGVRFVLARREQVAARIAGEGLAERLARLDAAVAGGQDLLEVMAIDYRAPFDFRRLPDDTADLIVSRDVLEHVPEGILAQLLAESRRILRAGGMHCHTIDMSDHWEHGDKSISRINFLQYEGALWDFACLNPQNYQNRLRRFEYVDLFRKAGLDVLAVSGAPDPRALEAAGRLALCRRYIGVAREELAVLTTTLIARAAEAH